MARFHFHSADGSTFVDEEGAEIEDLGSARVKAARTLATMLRDKPHHPWDHGGMSVNVTDPGGLTLFTMAVIVVDAPAGKAGL